jgi:hypothetical protein
MACAARHGGMTAYPLNRVPGTNWRMIMKTLLSIIVALSVLTGVAASASAFDAKTFYEQQDRSHGGA